MKCVIVLFVVLLLSGFVVAEIFDDGSIAGSEAQINFSIAGCDYYDGNVIADKCSTDRTQFCFDNGDGTYDLQATSSIPGACSFGEMSAPEVGDPQCCPSGWVCLGDSPVCLERTTECSSFPTEDECNAERCYWLESTDQCVDSPLEYSCDVYTNNDSCTMDTYGLGQNGFEAIDKCGTYFNAAGEMWGYHNCACEWDNTANSCNLGYEVTCFIGEDCGSFKCLKSFNIGECIEGVQVINWSAIVTGLDGQFESPMSSENQLIYDDVLAVSCANNDGTERSCGAPVVKLPGFSFFSLFTAIGILSLFYVFKKDL